MFNKFSPIVDTCLSREDTARQSCSMLPRWQIFWQFLRPVFAASRVQHISDLHSKFALRPHHVWMYGRHQICDRWDWARKEKKKKERKKKERRKKKELECGPMPNVMVVLPNRGGALCSAPQSLADAYYLTAVQ